MPQRWFHQPFYYISAPDKRADGFIRRTPVPIPGALAVAQVCGRGVERQEAGERLAAAPRLAETLHLLTELAEEHARGEHDGAICACADARKAARDLLHWLDDPVRRTHA